MFFTKWATSSFGRWGGISASISFPDILGRIIDIGKEYTLLAFNEGEEKPNSLEEEVEKEKENSWIQVGNFDDRF